MERKIEVEIEEGKKFAVRPRVDGKPGREWIFPITGGKGLSRVFISTEAQGKVFPIVSVEHFYLIDTLGAPFKDNLWP